MISKVLFFFFVLLLVGLFNYYAAGVEGSTPRTKTLSNLEATREKDFDFDLEFERQLKFLNKPPIKTINAENGDTFYCVDIHKQPALDHPLLKNHKIQMRPNSRPKGVNENKKKKLSGQRSNYLRGSSSTIFKPLGCPEGTVPIQRTTKEDLIRAKPFFESYTPISTTNTGQTSNNDGQHMHIAIRRSKEGNNETYYGVFGWLNLANPSYVLNDQFSAGQVWVEGGKYEFTTLQAGWAVSPQLFQDNKTRLFGYSNSDLNFEGCYNLLCQGFVLINKDITFGQEFTPSVYNGEQHILALQIYKDEDSSSWWLAIGNPDDDQMKAIGYWPGEIYEQLVNGASYVAWGGMVKENSKGQSPSMGNGYAPDGSLLQYKTVCSVMQLQVIYSNFTFTSPNESAFENFVDSQICYRLDYSGFLGKFDWGYSFLYGGPGGNNCGITYLENVNNF